MYGVSGRLLAWIKGWPWNRWQSGSTETLVRVEKGDEWNFSGIGVGACVVLGELEEVLMSEVLKFADDTKIFWMVDSEEDRNVLQRDLDRLVRRSEVWPMKFNVEKCKVMHPGRGNA